MVKILVIDDAAEDRGFVERVLRQCKIANPIQLLHSGQEALSFFLSHPDERCLVFLDLFMAPVSGISVLRKLKEDGLSQDSIFIMLSGLTDIKLINEGYKQGARTFLIKPLKTDDILELLNALKERITVETTPEEYVLTWANSQATPGSEPKVPGNTEMLRRGVSLSA